MFDQYFQQTDYIDINQKLMKKVFTSNLYTPKTAKGKQVAQFPGTQAFFPLKTFSEQYGLLVQPALKRKVECYRLNIQRSKDDSFMQTYSWRFNTSLPIVKTLYVNVVSQQEYNASIQVFNEHCPYRLEDLDKLPVSTTLYLLKESLIGFERLWQRFGPFIPTAKMVAINQFNRCKVWMHQNFAFNTVSKVYQSEEDFLTKIFEIFEKKTTKNQAFKTFFREASICKKFLKAFKMIDAFIQAEKIKVPTKFDALANEQRKSVSIREGLEMKSSNMNNFFKSANYTKELSKGSDSKKVQCYADGSLSAYHLTTRTHSPFCDNNSNGTTVSQTYKKKPDRSLVKNSMTRANLDKESNLYGQDDSSHSPKTPMRKPHSKRVKGSLFMSGSIDADFIGHANKQSIINKFPQLKRGLLAESKMMSPQQLLVLQSKVAGQKIERFQQSEIQRIMSSRKNGLNSSPPKKLPMHKRSTMQEEDQNNDIVIDFQPILMKNGWQRRIGNLLGGNQKQIMQSRCEGKQIRAATGYIRLLKLEAMGAGVVDSILPDQLDI